MSRRLFAIALCAGLAACAAADDTPAELKLANMTLGAAAIDTELCGPLPSADECRTVRIAQGEIAKPMTLPPGRYRLRFTAGEAALAAVRYGLGPGQRYTLVLYGHAQAMQDPERRLWAAAKRLLGGIDEPAVHAYVFAQTMLLNRPGKADDPARLRVLNLVPARAPITLGLGNARQQLDTGPRAYAEAGDTLRLPPGEYSMRARYADSAVVLSQRDISLAAGAIDNLLIRADGNGAAVVVDHNPRQRIRRP